MSEERSAAAGLFLLVWVAGGDFEEEMVDFRYERVDFRYIMVDFAYHKFDFKKICIKKGPAAAAPFLNFS